MNEPAPLTQLIHRAARENSEAVDDPYAATVASRLWGRRGNGSLALAAALVAALTSIGALALPQPASAQALLDDDADPPGLDCLAEAHGSLRATAGIVAITPCLVLVLAFHRRVVAGLTQGFVKG